MPDPAWLFVSLVIGSVGFVLFAYGRKQGRWPQMCAGLLLMVYPYFTPGLFALTGVGVAICGALWYAVRVGW